jgi:hypothetical protein
MNEILKFKIFIGIVVVSFFFGLVVNGVFLSVRRVKLMKLVKEKNLSKWIEMNGPLGVRIPNSDYEWNDDDCEIEEIRVLKSRIRKGVISCYLVFPWIIFVGLVFHFCFGLFNGWTLNR